MSLKNQLNEYKKLQDAIRRERQLIRQAIKKNQAHRQDLNRLKGEIVDSLANELSTGRTIYHLCIKYFGKIDWRFHAIYAIFRKATE